MYQDPNVYPEQPVKTGNGMAVAALVCGLVGLLLFGVVLGLLAIIFGAIGLSNANKSPIGAGKGMATAGLILGIVDILFSLVLISMIMR